MVRRYKAAEDRLNRLLDRLRRKKQTEEKEPKND